MTIPDGLSSRHLVLVRKIGVPGQAELAMGAVVDGPPPLTVCNGDVIRLAGIAETEFIAGIRDASVRADSNRNLRPQSI